MRMNKEVSLKCLLIFVLLLFPVGFSGCTPKSVETAARPEKVDADLAKKLLADGNKRFVEGKTFKKDFLTAVSDPLQKSRRPFAVFLACSESDASPEILFDRNIGDFVVVRTVGNVLDPIVLGSIEYGVEHYKAPLVVVLGHKNCGIIQEALQAKEQCPGNIPQIQAKVKHAVNEAEKSGEQGDALLARAATYNVTEVVEELKTSPIIQEFKARHGLKVIGATYNAKTGRVDWIEDGGCDLGEGFVIPKKKTKTAEVNSKKWKKPAEKIE